MTETDIQSLIMLELSRRRCVVHRRNTGKFYAKRGDEYVPINIGVRGQADLQGHRPDGKCFYLEIKTPDECERITKRLLNGSMTSHDKEQMTFLVSMGSSGALAGFACDVEGALEVCEIT